MHLPVRNIAVTLVAVAAISLSLGAVGVFASPLGDLLSQLTGIKESTLKEIIDPATKKIQLQLLPTGPGSGLDADLLDGAHAASFALQKEFESFQSETTKKINEVTETVGSLDLSPYLKKTEQAADSLKLAGKEASYYLNATNLTSGTLLDTRLSSNVSLLDLSQTFTAPKTFAAGLTLSGGTLALPTGSVTSSFIADGTILSADISSSAGIAYGKLNLTGSILGSDLASNISISTTGNLTTTGSGIITSAGLLTASSGFTLSAGTLTLPGSSIADPALSSNVALLTGSQTFTGSKTFSSAIAAPTSANTINGLVINSGALSGITTIGLSGAISGATATNTINGLVINSGAISNVTSLSLSGAISGATSTNTINGLIVSSGNVTLANLTTSTGSLTSTVADGASAVGFVLGTSTTYSTSGAKLLSVKNNATEQFSVDKAGNLTILGTATAAKYTRSCPTGYVPVPGNPKFGTVDFCVMKYEAKDDGLGNAVSQAAGTPWVSISQQTAEDKARAACSGCRLITEAEWMTIATDILGVASNWSSGTVGSGSLYGGHMDNFPANSLAADVTGDPDDDPYVGTNDAATNGFKTPFATTTTVGDATKGKEQRRTFTLSNGSVIWDFSGNVWEWTNATVIGNQEPDDATDGFAWTEFTAITNWGVLNYANPTNRGWNSAQGLGQIYAGGLSTDNTLYAFIRGGNWGSGADAGAFTLYLSFAPTSVSAGIGFRVAR